MKEARIIQERELPAFVLQFHDPECPCLPCDQMRLEAEQRAAAHVPVEPATPVLDAFCQAGWLAGAGILIGSAIAFAIDPHGATHALAAAFTWSA